GITGGRTLRIEKATGNDPIAGIGMRSIAEEHAVSHGRLEETPMNTPISTYSGILQAQTIVEVVEPNIVDSQIGRVGALDPVPGSGYDTSVNGNHHVLNGMAPTGQ